MFTLGVPFGIYLAAKSNWQLPFMVIGISALIICGFVFLFFPAMKSHLKTQEKKMRFVKTEETKQKAIILWRDFILQPIINYIDQQKYLSDK